MINLQVTDGNKRNRSLEIKGFVKPSGTICAKVTNDKGAQYFVVITANKSTCTCEGNSKWNRTCYHIREVRTAVLPTYDELVAVSIGEAVTAANEQVHAHIDAAAVAGDRSYAESIGYAGDPRVETNPKTGMTDAQWQQYRNYEMSIGA